MLMKRVLEPPPGTSSPCRIRAEFGNGNRVRVPDRLAIPQSTDGLSVHLYVGDNVNQARIVGIQLAVVIHRGADHS